MSDETEAAAAVAALVHAVNGGDFAAAIAAFAEDPVIVEDLPPYRWTGASAPSQWLAAMGGNAASLGVTSVVMEIGEPRRTEVNGNRAYVIVPGLLRLTTAGPELRASGFITLTLDRQSGRWLIDTLVWSGSRPE